MRASLELTAANTQDLKIDQYPREQLIEDLTTMRAEVREYRELYAALEERVWIVEHQLVEYQGASTSSQAPHGTILHM